MSHPSYLTPALLLLGACASGADEKPAAIDDTASRASSAAAALDQMDARMPIPLLPTMAQHQKQSMRDHLVAVQEIIGALAADDFAGVEQAVERIGSSEQMGRMCTHLGAGAPGFTEQALGFHRTADRIAVAARERDRARVLDELSVTLQTCTSCHAAWKQSIVDEATFDRLTAGHAR